MAYIYRGTQVGAADPWQQEEEEAPELVPVREREPGKKRKHLPNPGAHLPPGVVWHPASGKYQARIKYKGRQYFNGTFADPELAATAAEELREKFRQQDPEWGRLRPCGTHAAFQRHHRNGEDACKACRKAESQYVMKMRRKAAA